ncbi:hypothetical protein T439DRAFT_320978 [Meredithblackwellia eburnea MCA 4105]
MRSPVQLLLPLLLVLTLDFVAYARPLERVDSTEPAFAILLCAGVGCSSPGPDTNNQPSQRARMKRNRPLLVLDCPVGLKSCPTVRGNFECVEEYETCEE